ncbi:glycyl-radical enzyme activating protein [Desulfosarcina sp.]|uniref:glycyl-radical enzyme activating protein n=1 Tax=Desulfosarcina sp. TaxID=2027861 RepID=UPI00356178F9
MIEGTLFRIKRYALHDGPGIRTTVFFKGCPLSCRWCHNPEGLDPRPQTMSRRTSSGEIRETVGAVIGVNDLIKEIEKDVLFYDESGGGVTFSGGEPLAQPEFLEAMLVACNHLEIHAALDTSGYAPSAVLDPILPRLQLVLFDLKIMDEKQHRRYTGASNRTVLDNLKRIDDHRTPVRIRVPLIPGITDGDDNIAEIVRFAGSLKTLQGVDLLPFHRIGIEKYRRLGMKDNTAGISPPSPERVAAIQRSFESAGLIASIGG